MSAVVPAEPTRAPAVGSSPRRLPPPFTRASSSATRRIPLDAGWEAARTTEPLASDSVAWRPAVVPGTAAAVLEADGSFDRLALPDLDAEEWSFRVRFDARPAGPDEEVALCFGGIATVAEVVRWFRTTLVGRAPGFAPGPATVGPWRPVWLERRRHVAVDAVRLRTRVEGDSGIVDARATLREIGDARVRGARLVVTGRNGTHVADLAVARGEGNLRVTGTVRIPDVARWWPHTHGEPVLHDARFDLTIDDEVVEVDAGRVGFRSLTPGPGATEAILRDGLELSLNGVRVFVRGAVWTPLDLARGASVDELRATLERLVAAGMNMVRVPGLATYESTTFHDLCDELGVLVWQDFMFANLDYPFADEDFAATVEAEARTVLAEVGGRSSTAVLCGNSEIEQQVAMLGLDPSLGRGAWFGERLPALIAEAEVDAAYVPSSPSGGDLPFRPDAGVANYYGVGGYRRPLTDTRLAGVRFAGESLAFANVPDAEVIDDLAADAPGSIVVHHPRWKASVPRDNGSGWDFDDVRDFYLRELHGLDPEELRRVDHERYLELSRFVSGEVMAEVFGEWRRAGSRCAGALVLWLRDLEPGAGWGILDSRGRPKVAWHVLRRALAPIAVWTTDEGLAGIDVHVVNDTSDELAARLRVAFYRDGEQLVETVTEDVVVPAHGAMTRNAEALLGRFVDASWAYRFGPPGHDLVVATLEAAASESVPRDTASGNGDAIISQAFRFPAGRPTVAEPPDRIGLEGTVTLDARGAALLRVTSRRLAYGVRIHADGFEAADDAFSIEPGGSRTVELRPRDGRPVAADGRPVAGDGRPPVVRLTALNVRGDVAAAVAPDAQPPARAAAAERTPGVRA